MDHQSKPKCFTDSKSTKARECALSCFKADAYNVLTFSVMLILKWMLECESPPHLRKTPNIPHKHAHKRAHRNNTNHKHVEESKEEKRRWGEPMKLNRLIYLVESNGVFEVIKYMQCEVLVCVKYLAVN